MLFFCNRSRITTRRRETWLNGVRRETSFFSRVQTCPPPPPTTGPCRGDRPRNPKLRVPAEARTVPDNCKFFREQCPGRMRVPRNATGLIKRGRSPRGPPGSRDPTELDLENCFPPPFPGIRAQEWLWLAIVRRFPRVASPKWGLSRGEATPKGRRRNFK